ncbi:MAG TPA: substrate-binding domain-containing protein [Thermoanaerobaculia bacterium]
MSDFSREPSGPRATILGKIVVFLFIAGCAYGAWSLYQKSRAGKRAATPRSSEAQGASSAADDGSSIQIGIAYGTEKRNWLEWAVREFARTDAGRGIRVNLLPMGSLEGAQALVAGDERIHVWTPASSIYKDTFLQDWQLRHGGVEPIAKEESLALTPMVFVVWAEREAAFRAKYGAMNFDSIALALGEPTGWESIAGHPDWGLFKFGHTTPNESNSGLVTLLLMAYDHHDKIRGLTAADVVQGPFQQKLSTIERAVTLSPSTGTLMREMVLKGPSAFDAIFVYENVAIDYLKSAQGRWGELRILYPKLNLWNDNPYYVVNAPWSTDEHKRAAGAFLEFLMSEPVQRQALVHGFRPGNPSVPVVFAGSPFTQYRGYGLRNEIGQVCEPPKGEVITNLLASWQRSR